MMQAEGQQAAPARAAYQGSNVWIVRGPGRLAFDVVDGKVVGFVQGQGACTNEGVRIP